MTVDIAMIIYSFRFLILSKSKAFKKFHFHGALLNIESPLSKKIIYETAEEVGLNILNQSLIKGRYE